MANRVVVILSDDELGDVRRRAGLVPLSAWFRALAFQEIESGGGRSVKVVDTDGSEVTDQFKVEYDWDEDGK